MANSGLHIQLNCYNLIQFTKDGVFSVGGVFLVSKLNYFVHPIQILLEAHLMLKQYVVSSH